MERTLLLLKPDAVERGLVGEILARVERAGMRIVALSMQLPTEDLARGHYADDEHQLKEMGEKLLAVANALAFSVATEFGTEDPSELGRLIFERNVEFLMSGPVVVAVVEGFNAVRKTRTLCGSTMPVDAAPGSIRGDYSSVGAERVLFSSQTVHNLVHSSDARDVSREIAHWMGLGEIAGTTEPERLRSTGGSGSRLRPVGARKPSMKPDRC